MSVLPWVPIPVIPKKCVSHSVQVGGFAAFTSVSRPRDVEAGHAESMEQTEEGITTRNNFEPASELTEPLFDI